MMCPQGLAVKVGWTVAADGNTFHTQVEIFALNIQPQFYKRNEIHEWEHVIMGILIPLVTIIIRTQ